MSKILTSPIPEFPGTVTISDRFTVIQCLEIEKGFGDPNEAIESRRVWINSNNLRVLPALLTCVEKWEVEGIPENPTVETFPGTPVKEANSFILWVWDEIKKVYFGKAMFVPNE